ncbi:5486_t:CDS:2, partial [Acaulospora colombiana]
MSYTLPLPQGCAICINTTWDGFFSLAEDHQCFLGSSTVPSIRSPFSLVQVSIYGQDKSSISLTNSPVNRPPYDHQCREVEHHEEGSEPCDICTLDATTPHIKDDCEDHKDQKGDDLSHQSNDENVSPELDCVPVRGVCREYRYSSCLCQDADDVEKDKEFGDDENSKLTFDRQSCNLRQSMSTGALGKHSHVTRKDPLILDGKYLHHRSSNDCPHIAGFASYSLIGLNGTRGTRIPHPDSEWNQNVCINSEAGFRGD